MKRSSKFQLMEDVSLGLLSAQGKYMSSSGIHWYVGEACECGRAWVAGSLNGRCESSRAVSKSVSSGSGAIVATRYGCQQCIVNHAMSRVRGCLALWILHNRFALPHSSNVFSVLCPPFFFALPHRLFNCVLLGSRHWLSMAVRSICGERLSAINTYLTLLQWSKRLGNPPM
jgi:hypothetical protein